MAPNNQQRRISSSAKMLEAALEEFAEKGYTAARIENMAIKAGVSKGLYSQRFISKENLYLEALNSVYMPYTPTEDEGGSLEEETLRFVDMVKAMAVNSPAYFRLMCSLYNDADVPQSVRDHFKNQASKSYFYSVIEKQIREGKIKGSDAYSEFAAFAGSVCAITASFSRAGLALPDSENYLRLAGNNRLPDRNLARERVIQSLTDDYEGIIYVKVGENALEDVGQLFRVDQVFSDIIPNWQDADFTFHDRLEKLKEYAVHPEDRARFEEETRRPVILNNLREGSSYYIEFRTLVNGAEGNYQIKFVPFSNEEGEMEGFTAGLHNISEEINRSREEQQRRDIISVLASEYNAVYYCDALTHDYDICYQQGFVRAELLKTLAALPKFEDAFNGYIEMLVHPDDREMMRREISLFTGRLQNRSQYKVEFRRKYGDEYKYTTMKVVRVDKDKALRFFVVGFAESDAEYHRRSSQRKQLEYVVEERTKELRERNRALNRINEEVVELIGNITEARDSESGAHIKRVKGYTNILAKQVKKDWPEYKLSDETITLMTSAAALHDVGKVAISDTILLKPGKLTPDEFEIMKTHCDKGCIILEQAPKDLSEAYLKMSMDICRCHHEKYDGRGYPRGLKGDEIPISAQIVSIADCFDALTSKRVYKDAYGLEKAFNMILNGECGAYSEKMLKSFTEAKEMFFRVAMDNHEEISSPVFTGVNKDTLSWTRFILVEEDSTNLLIGNEILTGEGAEVSEAKSAEEALELFARSPEGYYDAILTDTGLDGMSASELATRVRSLDREDARQVAIIGLSAYMTENEINEWMAAGMDSCLPKPVAISSLEKVLYECFDKRKDALHRAVANKDEESERVLSEAIKKSPVFSSGYEDYEFICYIDGRDNLMPAYRGNGEILKLMDGTSRRLPSNRRLDRLFTSTVPRNELADFRNRVKRNVLVSYMIDHPAFHTFVPMNVNGVDTLYRLVIAPDKNAAECYIMGLKNVDTETKLESQTKDIIRNLSELYIVVDYIDFENDSFTRYQRLNDNTSVSGAGSYSVTLADYIEKGVHKDDVRAVTAFTKPENVKEQLRLHKKMSLRYRSVYTGSVICCEMQFINVSSDQNISNAIFTIENIDETVQRERRNDEMLIRAREILSSQGAATGNDLLTGVKSISAYTDAVARLSAKMAKNEDAAFGALVCDINGLKDINDIYGQNAGDVYIRNCCKIICDVFKRSPVYRTGGGSFTVLLLGDDYDNRNRLMTELAGRERDAQLAGDVSHGRASFSFGMAEYRRDYDEGVAEVLGRAEMEMLKNKASRLND